MYVLLIQGYFIQKYAIFSLKTSNKSSFIDVIKKTNYSYLIIDYLVLIFTKNCFSLIYTNC